MQQRLVWLVLLLATLSSTAVLAEPPYPIPLPAPEESSLESAHGPPALTVEPSILAMRELSLLQQREASLWEEHDKLRMGGPIAALAVGTPLCLGFLPTGVLVLHAARNSGAIGGSFIAVGVVGLATLTYGALRVSQLRHRRAEQEHELRAIGARRSVLERVLAPFVAGAPF